MCIKDHLFSKRGRLKTERVAMCSNLWEVAGNCKVLQKKNKTALNTAGPRAPAAAAAVNTSVFSKVSTDCQRALVRLRCK